MKKLIWGAYIGLLAFAMPLQAQVNSGSNGSDGEFHPTQDVTINMADHPNGIYQYTSVTIPLGVRVTFSPNPNNMPVVWLVQTNCLINGEINLSGQLGEPGGSGDGWSRWVVGRERRGAHLAQDRGLAAAQRAENSHCMEAKDLTALKVNSVYQAEMLRPMATFSY